MAVSSKKKQAPKSGAVRRKAGDAAAAKVSPKEAVSGKGVAFDKKTRTGNAGKTERPRDSPANGVSAREKSSSATNGKTIRKENSAAGSKNDGKSENSAGRGKNGKDNKRKDKVLYCVIAVLLVLIVLLSLKSCGILGGREMAYEETVFPAYEPDAEIEETEGILNLAVLPDYQVTEANPDMLVPFPDQNFYDIQLGFADQDTGKTLYQTDMIAPGSIISVPAYEFTYDGEHAYRVDVQAYDRETHEPVETAVSMEAIIIKK